LITWTSSAWPGVVLHSGLALAVYFFKDASDAVGPVSLTITK